MWARRIGVPATWPSRVKVFLYSLGTGAIGWTIYSFMASSNVGYLDLAKPSKDRVVCVESWPGMSEAQSWWNEDSWENYLEYKADAAAYLARYTCTVPSVANMTCDAVQVPLHFLQPALGAPMVLGDASFDWKAFRTSVTSKDALSIYAHLFLVLSVCLWLSISFHDHALLSTVNKDYILDLRGICEQFPRLHKVCGAVMGTSTIRRLVSRKETCCQRLVGLLVALVIVPILLTWRFLIFMFVICPSAGFLFFFHPIRTSRLWTFLICTASMVYGVVLSLHMLAFVTQEAVRPRYSVMWQAEATFVPAGGGAGPCTCGCAYPLSQTTCWRLFGIGLLATIKAFIIGFRCLKGLRRSNWANLLTVTFTVPVNAYSVEWTQSDGGPIKNRTEGQPVQSELAFDPFALMDEQPESGNSHVTLKPSTVHAWEMDEQSGRCRPRQLEKRNLMGPSAAPIYKDLENRPMKDSLEVMAAEYIGCCGFPCRTGGVQGRFAVSEPEPIERPHKAKLGVSDDEDLEAVGRGFAAQGGAVDEAVHDGGGSARLEEVTLDMDADLDLEACLALAPQLHLQEAKPGRWELRPTTRRGQPGSPEQEATSLLQPQAAYRRSCSDGSLSLVAKLEEVRKQEAPLLRPQSQQPPFRRSSSDDLALPRLRQTNRSPGCSSAEADDSMGREAKLSKKLPATFVPHVSARSADEGWHR